MRARAPQSLPARTSVVVSRAWLAANARSKRRWFFPGCSRAREVNEVAAVEPVGRPRRRDARVPFAGRGEARRVDAVRDHVDPRAREGRGDVALGRGRSPRRDDPRGAGRAAGRVAGRPCAARRTCPIHGAARGRGRRRPWAAARRGERVDWRRAAGARRPPLRALRDPRPRGETRRSAAASRWPRGARRRPLPRARRRTR
jgi:hypothetical protein